MATSKNTILRGDYFYILGSILGIETVCTKQTFKVQVHKIINSKQAIVIVKHFKTKEMDKITIVLDIDTLRYQGISINN